MSDHGDYRPRLWALAALVAVLAGCTALPSAPKVADKAPASPATPSTPVAPAAAAPPAATPAPVPAPAAAPEPSVAERELAEGIELYDRGEYNAAIAKLGSSSGIAAASVQVRTAALKYIAFSYCLTRRLTLCRAQFESAFKLDPAFDLEPAERGHPLWGPSFERAKHAHHAAAK